MKEMLRHKLHNPSLRDRNSDRGDPEMHKDGLSRLCLSHKLAMMIMSPSFLSYK